MAIKEQDKVFYEELANGDKVINLPVTRANNVEGLGRSANTAYVVGDVVYVDNNKKVALKCTQAGITSNAELNISNNNIGDTVTDGSVVWQVCNRTSDVTSVNGKTGDVVVDLPVGHMYWSVEPNVPVGRLPALGATYNRALYADLWAWANSVGLVKSESEWQAIASANGGNCAYYSSGDGSTTFRVPKLPNTIASDIPSENLLVKGTGINLGLTDGSDNYGLRASGGSGEYLSAAANIYGTSVGSEPSTTGVKSKSLGVTTDGSKSGMVAEAPKATKITGQWLIVAFGVAHNIGEADIANVMQAVETAQTSVQTVDNKITGISDYIVESYRNGAEWYEVYKSGKVRQGGHLTGYQTSVTVTFLKPFANVNYSLTFGIISDNSNSIGSWKGIAIENAYNSGNYTHNYTNKFNVAKSDRCGMDWIAEGQGA